MRFIFAIVLGVITLVGSSASGADYNRIKRPQQSSQGVRLKPLTGRIDYSGAPGVVDSSQFEAGTAQTDSDQFRGGAGQNAYQAGAGQNSFKTGAQQNSLQGRAKNPQFNMRVPKSQSPQLRQGAQHTRLPGDLSDKELTVLKLHDIVVMQDRSSSMGEDEDILGSYGFRKMSRWDWCLEQAMSLTRQTDSLPDWKMTVVTFSSKYDVYPNVTLSQLPQIYSRQGIFIGTRLAHPLAEQLASYFRRRDSGRARPLVIAVITDGKPQDDKDLRDILIQATHMMRNPNEISITFLQVGTDDDGQKKLRKLDQRLVQRGAKYDIIKVKPFYELLQTGLPRALVNAIQS